MGEVLHAAVLWVISHLALATDPIRQVLVSALGRRGYLFGYSVLALAALSNLIFIYTDVPRFDYLWLTNPDLYWVAKVTMPIASFLLVGAFWAQISIKLGVSAQEQALHRSPPASHPRVHGVLRITRHPFQWSVVLWSIGHLFANGDWVSLIFFSSFLLTSSLGIWLMDRKRARLDAATGDGYLKATSALPFVAILARRNRLVWEELWGPLFFGALFYAALYYFHESYTGALII